MKLTVNTPEGTRDRLFAECMGRRQVQERLIRLFRQRGYREVSTPETEFYDLFARSGSAIPQEQMVQVFDQSGKLCVMRPDSTTPIARVAATKLRALPLPQRLYYDQTVYRAGPAHSGGNRELPQCGVELIGAAGTPCGCAGPHGSMWSWATPASSGMWPPGWSWRRGRWSGCGP